MLWPQEIREELEGLRFERQSVGVYDTVYLTASSSRQKQVAPLVAERPDTSDAMKERGLRSFIASGRRLPAFAVGTGYLPELPSGVVISRLNPSGAFSTSPGKTAPPLT